MKTAVWAALPLLLCVVGCGKVGPPLPPVIRVPEAVGNLAAAQSGYTVVLSWTNPRIYIDANPATDLGVVHVFLNEVEIGTAPATGAGQAQSFVVDVADKVNAAMTFKIQMGLTKASRLSAASNSAAIQPVDVPGLVKNLRERVDQYQVILDWDIPERNGALAESYIIQRSDGAPRSPVRTTHFADTQYDRDKMYTYTVIAARGADARIPGDGSASVAVTTTDKAAPATPSGLEIEVLPGGSGAFLRWTPNTEPDLKEYVLYRSDREAPLLPGKVEAFSDNEYTPGVSYRIAARDFFGNESSPSEAKKGP